MNSRHICASLAVLAAIGAGASTAQAQANGPCGDQRQQNYQHLQDQYQDAQSRYQDQARDYAAKRETYEHQHGAYGRDFGRAVVYRGYDPYAAYRDNACERRAGDDAMAGGVIGALAGGALGSGMDREGDGPWGTFAGAVLGGAVGAEIGRSAAGCDDRGYFFTYYQTFPYREGGWERGPSGRHDNGFYAGRGCRLAIAPARIGGHTEDRYARVCPDPDDHYRFTS